MTTLALLSACYTATESTPRIKVDDEVINRPTTEQLVIDNNFTARGCDTWIAGKAFTSIDDKLSPMLRPEANRPLIEQGFMGKIFTYKGYRQENIYGNKEVVYLLYECDSILYSYYTGKSMQEIVELQYQPLIPTLVDMDEIAMARSLFVGKHLYILTNQWYDAGGQLIDGRQFIEVEVTAVKPGNSALPLALCFADNTGKEACVFITTRSSARTQMLSFDRLFSYDNPRFKYPDITDENWEAITEGRLIKGMTKIECRLAIGLPAEVKKVPTYSGLKEQWMYNNGSYLFFSDGLLEEFRQ